MARLTTMFQPDVPILMSPWQFLFVVTFLYRKCFKNMFIRMYRKSRLVLKHPYSLTRS